MAKKRTQGTGFLEDAGAGKWRVRWTTGKDPVTGKQRRRMVTFEAKGRKEAERVAARLIDHDDDQAIGTNAALRTVLDEWMRLQASRHRSPTTLYGYRRLIDSDIGPSLGHISIDKLEPHTLDRYYATLSERGLSPRTIRNHHHVISGALTQAVKWGWVPSNVAQRATLPSPSPLQAVAPHPDQVRALIMACKNKDPVLGAFVMLASTTGARRGEIAGWRWSDFDGLTMAVRRSVYEIGNDSGIKSTKSGRERLVPLDPATAEWLHQWRRKCERAALDVGVRLIDDAYVIPGWPDGSRYVNPKSIGQKFRRVADSVGMKEIHLHSLRHFTATELLASGIAAPDAAKILGHADASVTLNTYAHATQDRQRAAAAIMARVLEP